MGVDINTYRCRVGMFVPGGGCGFMSLFITFGRVVNLLGSLTLVRILLVMAGIEPNPGPTDKYIFRYQYLLVEIGTNVMRKVFDVKIHNDFLNHLSANNNKFYKELQSLISKKTITADQAQYLPPIDNSPKTTNFDITLLACLLRNVCGLRGQKDPVWKNPLPNDHSVEADLARLKECRNNLQHSGTVFISETDLTVKWNELSQILNRLNNVCGIPNFSSLINDAESMDIDEELKKRYDQAVKAWTDMNHLELRNRLLKFYKETCCTLPVSPLCDEYEIAILSIYKPPSLYHVPYHRTQEQEEIYSISSYKEIFCKDDRSFFRKIYITGDAGVGKTSFCKRMSFLWYKSQSRESVRYKSIQNDIDFMAQFDFVFYVSLRETQRKDVVTMIVEQLVCNENDLKKKEIYNSVENILRNNECMIIMDGLDDWTPKGSGKININQLLSDKCIFVTTCRPYKIENERLSPRDIDRQVQITGINESSIKRYVPEIVNHVNRANRDNKNPDYFIRDVRKLGLYGQLHIPIITSHLVAVWFEQKLTDMSRALIYSTIVDMLLKRAEKRKNIELPSSAESEISFPDSLSALFYFKKHISFLKKICLLSFNLLFKQDKSLSELVFTTEQLESEPYCVSPLEMDFLFKFGILSKSKVIGRFGKQEQKLSYLHETYLEYFAALFVFSFDSNNAFDNVVKKLTSINDVVQFENFFLFLCGFSCEKSMLFFESIYHTISDDLSLCRRNAMFHYDSYVYSKQIELLQTMVINCLNEVSRPNDPNILFKLEDFIFNNDRIVNTNVDLLKQILLLNRTCVKSLHSVNCKYYDEFDQIKNLEYLHVHEVLSGDYVKFTECMLQNQSTLHTVCIVGSRTLIPELPVRSLQHLTSLSLSHIKMQHNSLHNLLKFLSDNVHIENIKLRSVSCDNSSDCTLTLNLPHHAKLTSLCLWNVNISCNNVNSSSLKYITLWLVSEKIDTCYINICNCIKYSQLEHLDINGLFMLDYNTVQILVDAVKTLSYIKSLKLWDMEIPDYVLLQLHSDVTQVKIELYRVTMSSPCFHCFIGSFVNTNSVIKVELDYCIITSVNGETHRELSLWESLDYMSEYLTKKDTVNITCKGGILLHFETNNCQ